MIHVYWLKCQLSGDAPQGSWSSINGLNCYGCVVLDPIPVSATHIVYSFPVYLVLILWSCFLSLIELDTSRHIGPYTDIHNEIHIQVVLDHDLMVRTIHIFYKNVYCRKDN